MATEDMTEEHVLVTEQDQGHLMERLEDPEEVARMLHMHHRPHVYGISTETMADTIVRESLEARQAELAARMEAKGKKTLCVHGHEHDICCGAEKGDVEAGE